MKAKTAAILIPSALALGLIAGLVWGAKGCGGGNDSKLLWEVAQLKAETETHLQTAAEATQRAVEATERLEVAQTQIEASRAQEAASTRAIAALEAAVRRAGRVRDERDDLIEAQGAELDRLRRVDLFNQEALTEAVERGDQYQLAAASSQKAAEANGKRADLLEKRVRKSRKQKVAIGIGSALGGIGLTLATVYAVQRTTR